MSWVFIFVWMSRHRIAAFFVLNIIFGVQMLSACKKSSISLPKIA